jgi:hypothetical protein
MAADHLLLVKSIRFREEYKRFHLRDVQAIVVARAPRFHVSTRSMGIAALWWFVSVFMLRLFGFTVPFWIGAAVLVSAWVIVSAAYSCRCCILTAVSRDDLPSIYRTWTARRFLRKVEPRIAEGPPYAASAVKMCRSIMIKGLEAMVIESFVTARAYGVEDAVLASLAETLPGIDWEKQGAYFFQRVIEHGRRRSEEVREVAETVREIGLTPWSAQGTAERQAWVADLADQGVFGAKGTPEFARSADWRCEADRILTRLKSRG